MDKKLYNTWMTITALVLGIIGLAFILVSIFDSGAGIYRGLCRKRLQKVIADSDCRK